MNQFILVEVKYGRKQIVAIDTIESVIPDGDDGAVMYFRDGRSLVCFESPESIFANIRENEARSLL